MPAAFKLGAQRRAAFVWLNGAVALHALVRTDDVYIFPPPPLFSYWIKQCIHDTFYGTVAFSSQPVLWKAVKYRPNYSLCFNILATCKLATVGFCG